MFGKHLYSLRTAQNMTQRDLAEQVGVDYTYISKLENGAVEPPSERTTKKFAEVLGTNPDELLIKAGHIPRDICEYIMSDTEIIRFLRMVTDRNISSERWRALENVIYQI